MPREDWMRGERRPEDWRDRRDRRDRENPPREDRQAEPYDREDFGQADYSSDYAYDPHRRSGYRAAEDASFREDYGQADYSTDFTYDAERGRAYRRGSEEDRDYERRTASDDYRRTEAARAEDERGRSWVGRAFSGGAAREERARRRGPSDRVLWAVIVERLEDQRGLDLRDVEVLVEAAEVTLNGTVRRKEDKRRIEDIADIDGVRHVQNNLRVRDRGRWFS